MQQNPKCTYFSALYRVQWTVLFVVYCTTQYCTECSVECRCKAASSTKKTISTEAAAIALNLYLKYKTIYINNKQISYQITFWIQINRFREIEIEQEGYVFLLRECWLGASYTNANTNTHTNTNTYKYKHKYRWTKKWWVRYDLLQVERKLIGCLLQKYKKLILIQIHIHLRHTHTNINTDGPRNDGPRYDLLQVERKLIGCLLLTSCPWWWAASPPCKKLLANRLRE